MLFMNFHVNCLLSMLSDVLNSLCYVFIFLFLKKTDFPPLSHLVLYSSIDYNGQSLLVRILICPYFSSYSTENFSTSLLWLRRKSWERTFLLVLTFPLLFASLLFLSLPFSFPVRIMSYYLHQCSTVSESILHSLPLGWRRLVLLSRFPRPLPLISIFWSFFCFHASISPFLCHAILSSLFYYTPTLVSRFVGIGSEMVEIGYVSLKIEGLAFLARAHTPSTFLLSFILFIFVFHCYLSTRLVPSCFQVFTLLRTLHPILLSTWRKPDFSRSRRSFKEVPPSLSFFLLESKSFKLVLCFLFLIIFHSHSSSCFGSSFNIFYLTATTHISSDF